jgi:hypothetical protein
MTNQLVRTLTDGRSDLANYHSPLRHRVVREINRGIWGTLPEAEKRAEHLRRSSHRGKLRGGYTTSTGTRNLGGGDMFDLDHAAPSARNAIRWATIGSALISVTNVRIPIWSCTSAIEREGPIDEQYPTSVDARQTRQHRRPCFRCGKIEGFYCGCSKYFCVEVGSEPPLHLRPSWRCN